MYGEEEAKLSSAPSRRWAAERLRSDGPLDASEIAWCEANNVALAYDPVQLGAVPLHCIDDIVGPDDAASIRHAAADDLHFRRWRTTDADVFASLLGNARVWRFLPDRFPGPLDRASAQDLISLSNDADHHDVYAVEHRGAVVGQTRLLFDTATPLRDTAEISYWLGERYWGQALGSGMVAAFTRDSFARWPDLHSIVARVHKDNHASARVLTKARYDADPAALPAPWLLYRTSRASSRNLPL